MRLGGYYGVEDINGLEPLCEALDTHGLSAIGAPWPIMEMNDAALAAFGAKARSLGLEIGECGMWSNLMTDNKEERAKRIAVTREMLKKCDVMGCRSVVTLVGTKDPSDKALAMHPYMYTKECKKEFREIVLRIMDGLNLKKTWYIIEPWHNTFFYQPEDIREFIDSVGHPMFGLHLDQMNMVSQASFFNTTDLISRTFKLLSDRVISVHLKDIRHDPDHMFLKWDEVFIGDGVMDYKTYLKRLSGLNRDVTCYLEHMSHEEQYALCFARLHRLAEQAGVRFVRRGE